MISEYTILLVEALKTLGKEHVDEYIIASLKNRIPEDKLTEIRK